MKWWLPLHALCICTFFWTVKVSIVLRRLLPPTADSCIESSSIVTLPSPPRWLSTRLSVSRCCCTAANHGPLTDVTSRLLRLSMFVVFRPSLVSADVRKYHTFRCSRRLRLPRSNICWLKATALARAHCLIIVFLAGCSMVNCHKGNDRLVVLRNVSPIILELPCRRATSSLRSWKLLREIEMCGGLCVKRA